MSDKQREEFIEFDCYQCKCGCKEFIIGPGTVVCAGCGFQIRFNQPEAWSLAHEVIKTTDKKENIDANKIMVMPGPVGFITLLEHDKDATKAYKKHVKRKFN